MSSESRTECNSGYAESRMRKTNVNTFTFDVNIERLNPFTGQLLMVDRMTSDYAAAHPFDVDAYLEQVYQKWAECETVQFRETREALRKVWNAVLSDNRPGGNAALYPNAQEPHPALMEVWHKAGDFWRRGLRINDTLPAQVPITKITRLQDGSWIALFPKDKHLLEQPCEIREEVEEVEVADQTTPTPPTQEERTESEISEPLSICVEDKPATEPIEAIAEAEPMAMAPDPKPKRRARAASKPQNSKLKTQIRQLDLFGEPIETSVIEDAGDQSDGHKLLKAAGLLALGVGVMVILMETGMLIPMGLIGLAAGGFLR